MVGAENIYSQTALHLPGVIEVALAPHLQSLDMILISRRSVESPMPSHLRAGCNLIANRLFISLRKGNSSQWSKGIGS